MDDPTLTTPDEPIESKPAEATGSGRYAVYDTVEQRFRGRVHDSKRAAGEAKPDKREGDPRGRYEVREV